MGKRTSDEKKARKQKAKKKTAEKSRRTLARGEGIESTYIGQVVKYKYLSFIKTANTV